LSRDANLSRTMGTRHRAALGITEETDAAVVIVSEETGSISIACRGAMMKGLSEKNLENELEKLMMNSDRSSESLTDILDSGDERERAVKFHDDEDPLPTPSTRKER